MKVEEKIVISLCVSFQDFENCLLLSVFLSVCVCVFVFFPVLTEKSLSTEDMCFGNGAETKHLFSV